MNKPFKVNSVAVPLIGDVYLDDQFRNQIDPGLENFIDRIVKTGADSVRLIVSSVMNKATDNNFDPILTKSYNPSNDQIIKFANLLKIKGISVELNPLVIIANREDSNSLISDRINPTDTKLWMQNYSDQLMEWVKLAEQISAARITLFSDLEQHMLGKLELTDDWISLSANIKKNFSGQLTSVMYTDGKEHPWGTHIGLIPDAIWKSLDVIGLSPFVEPLTNKLDPTTAELESAWYQNADGVKPVEYFKFISEKYDKPIYFSDRTFRSFDGTNINEGQIFQSNVTLQQDLNEQADLFASFLRVFSLEQADWLLGVSFNSITRIEPYQIDSPARYLKSAVGEDWEGKPAADVLSAWFNGNKQSGGKYFLGDKDSVTIVLSSTINSDATIPKVSVYINNDLFLENASITSGDGQRLQSYTFDISKYDQVEELRFIVSNTTYIDQSNFSNVIIKRISFNSEELPLINGEFSNGASTNGFTYSNAGTVIYKKSAFDQINSLQTKSDRLIGGYHHDTLEGGLGDDYLDGGAGFDVAVYRGKYEEYLVTEAFVEDRVNQRDGIDSIVNIERLRFADSAVALDTDGNAGQAYRLYQAALDRTPDQRGLADWINYMDNGGQLNAMAQMFIDSQEFRTKYGALDNFNFVNQLYLNVLDRNGEATGVNAWVGALNGGALSRAQVLAGFSESSENQANVIGQIKDGIPYTEYWLE